MKCLKKEILTRYADNELPEARRNAVESHLEECTVCQKTLAIVKQETAFVGNKLDILRPEDVTVPVFHPTMAAARREKKHRPHSIKDMFNSSIRIPIPAMAIMIIMVIFMGLLLFLQNRKIEKLESPLHMKQPALYILSENKLQTINLDKKELKGFKPIKKPKIFVNKEPVK